MGEVRVPGTPESGFSCMVEITLKLKGVEYNYMEEDLQNKSALLLQCNPIHKKTSVLIHNGNPIVESLVILEYIDEVWKDYPILPSDPYQRAQARFWARFINEKFRPTMVSALMGQGEESDKAMTEAHDHLKTLENEILGKKFLAGGKIGYLDIAGIGIAYWVPILQSVAGKKLLTREEFARLCSWADELLGHSIIKDNLPNKEKLIEIYPARLAAHSTK